MRRWMWGVVALALAEGAVLALLAVRALWRAEAEGTAVVRGRGVAERMGCFGCHGPGGAAGIANPGAKTGSVPSWPGGTWMMYNHDERDVRGWILDGHPPGRQPDAEALIKMPAYRSRLGGAELADLVAYVLAASQFGRLDDPRVSAGRDAAVRFGCFGCHGPEGRGLTADPGSLKGYVPPWDGPDYADLVRSDEEFRQWVRHGITDRFRANPAARHFVEGEIVRMPAFGERVGPDDLDALLAYVAWVRGHRRGEERGSAPHR